MVTELSLTKKKEVEISTGPFVKHPVSAFEFVHEVKSKDPTTSDIKVEVYPFRFGLPGMSVSSEKLKRWSDQYSVGISRIHQSWMYSWSEMGHQAFLGDWYETLRDRVWNIGAMIAITPANSGYGLRLAEDLGVPATFHPNSVYGLYKDGRLRRFRDRGKIPEFLIENSVKFNSPVLKDREALGDPITTIERVLEPLMAEDLADGFVFAMDHLFGIARFKHPTESELDNFTDQVVELFDHPKILKFTKVIHLAASGHKLINPEDVRLNKIFTAIRDANFANNVSVVMNSFDEQFNRMSLGQQVDYFLRLRSKILAG